MRTSLLLVLAALLVGGLVAAAQPLAAAPSEPDDRVTPATAYVRHDGGTDRAIQHCSDTSTSTAPDVPDDGDTDSNDGGAFRQGNEPTVAIDPTNPNLVVAGWNDYCDIDLGGGWMGLALLARPWRDWTPSKIPGYPSDTSAEGMASPLHGRQAEAGDPLLAFDSDGRLFAGGIAFNRVNPQNGDVWVATLREHAAPERLSEGLPAHRGRRPGHPGAGRHLPGQAGARGRPHRRCSSTATSTSAGRGSSASTAGPASTSAARPTRARRSPTRSSSPTARTCRAATSRSSTTATST